MGHMRLIGTSFSQALGIIKKDKMIIFLSLFPILLGMILYGLIGYLLFYHEVLDFLKGEILTLGIGAKWGPIVEYALKAVIIFALYFLFSGTFILAVSILSAPFNDAISNRTERGLVEVQQTHSMGFFRVVFNELKKIVFLISLTTLGSIFLFFIPFLDPILLPLMSSLLITVVFIDYSWSRHGYTLSRCLKDMWNNLFIYTTTGLIALIFNAIPVLNLLTVPFAVVYFTVLFADRFEQPKPR